MPAKKGIPIKRAVIYSRVSTSRQEVAMQLRECKAFCKRAGWNVVEVITEQASGAKRTRPGLNKLLRLCHERRTDVLVIWKLDRLSRSLADLLNTAEELKALGVNLVSLHDQIDTTTPAGKALFQLVGVFAEFERELARERVKAGLEAARAKGKRLGRPKADSKKLARAQALLKEGLSLRKAAATAGVSAATLFRAKQRSPQAQNR
jgi:DNA invertase Pin-like site-specific DNA recombinase